MTEEEARARLERMVAYDIDPVLDTDAVDDLLVIAKTPDIDGLLPSDDDWTPTWNLNMAAATGWEWKAAKAAGRFDFGEDGQRFNASQVAGHCLKMAALFGGSGSASIRSVVDTTTTVTPVD
jgi:hypothetical protein